MANNYDTILIRYGEMILKGHNKKDFIKRLVNNLKLAFKAYPEIYYLVCHDRIYLELNGVDGKLLVPTLSTIFGISSFSLAIRVNNDLEMISECALGLAKNSTKRTFKVKAHRSCKDFPHISDEINRSVAGNILRNTELKVDVHNPELVMIIEVREKYTYITDNKILGAQGFPVGSSNKVLLLLSGGIDSTVAGYLAMKRGLKLECLHFQSAPYTSHQALMKVEDLAKRLSIYQGHIKLHVVNFTDMQLAINEAIPESYRITIMRRMMMRIAEKVASDHHCLALVNGESIGQVASQTIESMQVIGEVVKLPIIRPLVTYDKSEIITLSKLIGSYDISILPYEDCCTIFTPKNPTTKPNSGKAEHFESKFDYQELVEQCISNLDSKWLELTVESDLF